MDEEIYQIAEQIVEIHQKAYEVYLPLVEDVCIRIVSEAELSHLLDYLLDFACDEKILELYKKVCRRYSYVYPGCIKFYIEAYREMWGNGFVSLTDIAKYRNEDDPRFVIQNWMHNRNTIEFLADECHWHRFKGRTLWWNICP